MKNILVYGSGSFGHLIRSMVGDEFFGYIDDFEEGVAILGTYEEVRKLYKPPYKIAIGIGYRSLEKRLEIIKKIEGDDYALRTLVHTDAMVDLTADIGEGSVVMAGAVVGYNAVIGEASVLWNGVVVSHDSIIGNNTFLSPNCTVCGFSKVGDNCFIGAGAVITDHFEIPNGSFVKAGSVNNWK